MSRLLSGWLIVLILAPFTAPFPTCDLATFLGHGNRASANGGSASGIDNLAHHRSAPSLALTLARRHVRRGEPLAPARSAVSIDEAAVPSVASMFGAGRSRLVRVLHVSSLENHVCSSAAAVCRSVASSVDARQHAARGTVLRV